MPKRIPQEVKTKAMEFFLEGKPAREIAEKVSDTFNIQVKPSTIYAWANQYKWGETRAVSRADAVLGAGILSGADPKNFKGMRKAGADFFYNQQKQFKRIYDITNASKQN